MHNVRKTIEIAECATQLFGNADPLREHARSLLVHVADEDRHGNEQTQTVEPEHHKHTTAILRTMHSRFT